MTAVGHRACGACGGPGGDAAYDPGAPPPALPYAGAPLDPLAPSRGRWLCAACATPRDADADPAGSLDARSREEHRWLLSDAVEYLERASRSAHERGRRTGCVDEALRLARGALNCCEFEDDEAARERAPTDASGG